MRFRKGLMTAVLVAAALAASLPAFGSSMNFTCAANVDATQAGTCAYLNSTIAGLYTGTFNNVNANIYIQMGITGLGSSTVGFYNDVSYGTYLSDLTSLSSGDAVDTAAISALNSVDTPVYGGGNVVITSALGLALGIPGGSLFGTTSGGVACAVGSAGCYNGIITITTPANLSAETGGTQGLYWNQAGGSQPSNDYNFYSVVEHEVDEVLGTSSCIDTQSGSLTDPCNFFGAGTPSAVDLFRYSAPGSLVRDSSLSTTPGAYFSYDGGVTNGVPTGAVYNTLANGNDYADFVSKCPGGPINVQDANACPGSAPGITTDGGGEINILDAIGYNMSTRTAPPIPEPTSVVLLLTAVGLTGFAKRRLGSLR